MTWAISEKSPDVPAYDVKGKNLAGTGAGEGVVCLPDDVVAFLRKKMADDAEADEIEENMEEWHHAAHVVDRFLLIIFFSVILFMSLAFFMMIVNGP